MTKSIKFTAHFIQVLFAFGLLTSCENENNSTGEYSNGVFITNEGSFGNNNGSISFYSNETDSVYNTVFKNVNSRVLGDVVQSMTIAGDMAYIVVNNSNKVEVANKNTLVEAGVIENLPSPRYMVADDNKGYISCWGTNSVFVVHLDNLSVYDTLEPHGAGPDKMLLSGKFLYVINSGGWGSDSTVSVYETESGNFVKNIDVPSNPKDLVEDKNGKIWVLSYGNEIYNEDWTAIIAHSPSMLYQINPETNTVVASGILFEDKHPSQLEIDKNGTTLYIGGGYTFEGIYSIEISGNSLTLTKISSEYLYGLNVDPSSGVIFAALSGDYSSGGTLKRLNTDGTLLGTYTCGIGTSGAAFKYAR